VDVEVEQLDFETNKELKNISLTNNMRVFTFEQASRSRSKANSSRNSLMLFNGE
jgi:hypothetical protein